MRKLVYIVDDEPHSVKITAHYLKTYCPEVKLVGSAKNVNEALEFLGKNIIHILILDINLKKELGFELLQKLKSYDFKVIILSAHREYGIHGIKFNVCDYLLKPLSIAELKEAIGKCIEDKISESESNIAISERSGVRLVALNRVLYLRADSNYTHIIEADKRYVTSVRLGEILKKIEDPKFIRCHKSFVVNLSYITHINKGKNYLLLSSDERIPLNRTSRDTIEKRLKIIKL